MRLPAELLESAFEDAPFCVAILRGEDFVYEFANAAHRAYAPGTDFDGRRAFDVFPRRPDDYRPIMLEVLRTGESRTLENQPILGGRFMTISYRRLTSDPPRLIVYSKETTSEVLACRERETLHRRLSAVLEQIPSGIVIAEPTGRVILVNEKVRKLVANPPVGASSVADYAGIGARGMDGHPYRAEEYALARALRGETVSDMRNWVPGPDGTERLVHAHASPIRDEDGSIIAAIVRVDDITTQHQQEHELRHAAEVREQFLAMLSHELRAPLAALLLWNGVLRSPRTDEATRKRAIDAISECAVQQARLIDDLLDVSRALSGKLRIERGPVDIEPLIRSVVDAILPGATDKGLHIITDLAVDLGRLRGDVVRLRQVLTNLLSNAIKFTDSGGRITIRARAHDEKVEIAVADTGQGIAPAALPAIFDPFTQASAPRPGGGLGLGLTIARQLIELHGGSLRAESPGEGQGATFTVVLPRERNEREALTPPVAPPPPTLPGLRVLVVDDDTAARMGISALLGLAGAEVVSATSAAEARTKLGQARFDLVLCDIGMPDEDGYEFIARARAAGLRTPAIALTAYARPEDRARAIAHGFDEHLSKPVHPDRLIEALGRLATRS